MRVRIANTKDVTNVYSRTSAFNTKKALLHVKPLQDRDTKGYMPDRGLYGTHCGALKGMCVNCIVFLRSRTSSCSPDR